jgi:hypothetical protein
MKKTMMIVFCTMFFYNLTYAQLEKGKVALGGVVGFSFQSVKQDDVTDKNISFSILPSAEFFLADKFSLGADVGYMGQIYEYPQENGTNKEVYSLFLFQPYVKKYLPLGEHMAFFGKGQLIIGFGSYKDTYNDNSYKNSLMQFGFSIIPGISLLLSKKALLEASIGSIGFTSQIAKDEDDNKTTTNNFSFLLNPAVFTLGFMFVIN